MPPTSRRDDRAALPHRLGDGEPEALGEALLDHDVGAALQRVDDHGVLVGVVHRQQREVHAAADRAAAAPCHAASTSSKTSAPSGSSATAVTSGPASSRCGSSSAWTCSANAASDAQRVLEAVPARDLGHQRHVEAQRRAPRRRAPRARPCPTLPSRRSKIAREWWWWSAARPAARSTAVTDGERHRVVLGREGVDRGRDDRDLGGVEPLPGVARAREDVGVGALDVGDEEAPRLAREVVGHVEADVRAPDDRHARLDQRRDHARRSAGRAGARRRAGRRAAPAARRARRRRARRRRARRRPAARRRRRSRAGGCAGAW